MGIRYINADPNQSFTRPTGFVFPTGLSISVTANTTVDYLVVAGGGGSGRNWGGGGGGGAIKYANGFTVTPSTNYTVTVGGGGSTPSGGQGGLGSNSSFGPVVS